MGITGKVLWYSDRDQNGIIVDNCGNEYYFDCSVHNLKVVKSGEPVIFDHNTSIKDCLCARNVRLLKGEKHA